MTIPAGAEVLLDVDTPVLAGLMVHGKLIFEDKPGVGLDTEWLMVMGPGSELRIGTEAARHQSQTHLTFHGTDRTINRFGVAPLHSGNKFLMAMDGGKLSLHGASATKLSWMVIDADANPGDTSVLLAADPTGWTVGDQLALAPSGYIPTEAEKLTITAIEGRRVSFTPALQFRHFGRLQTIAGRSVDMRAEIGLLTRNIVLRGADDSLAQHFGGHVMIMGGGFATIEGAEFTRMGQRGLKGRYSLHWHWFTKQSGLPATGQYVRNCSFHDAFQRAVNIHKTNGVRVLNNVAYNIGNHAYVTAEDGDEELNVFEDNLGILTRTPAPEHLAFPSGGTFVPSLQNEHRAAVFWGKNPNNTLRRNHAAGGESGFFFDGEFMGTSEDNPTASARAVVRTADAIIEDNVSHSNAADAPPFEPNIFYPFFTNGHGIFFRDFTEPNSGQIRVRRHLSYKNGTSGAWLEDPNQIIEDSVFADMALGVSSEGPAGGVVDSLFVGRSANDVGGHPHNTVGFFSRGGFRSNTVIQGNTFVNVLNGAIFVQKGLTLREDTVIRNNRVVNGPPIGITDSFVGRLLDADGSLTGTGVPTYLSRFGFSEESVPSYSGTYYTTPVSAVLPTGPYFKLDYPTENQLIGHESRNGKVELLYRSANWDPSVPGWYTRIFVDGREVTGTDYGNPNTALENNEIPGVDSEGGITTHTLTIGLYAYDRPIRTVTRTFRYSRQPQVELSSPAEGSTHDAPVAVSFDSTRLFNVRGVAFSVLSGTVSFRLELDGVDAGPILSARPIVLDRLTPGAHTVAVVARNPADGAILARDSRRFTTTFTPAAPDPTGSTPPEVGWLSPLPLESSSVRDTVPLNFSAFDAEGFISRVEVVLNGAVQRILVTPPFSTTLTGLDPGTYTVRASAVDGDGLRADTATREFRVVFPPMPFGLGSPVLRVNPADGLLFNDSLPRHALPAAALNGLTRFTASAWVRRAEGSHNDARIFAKTDGVFEPNHELMLSLASGSGLRTRLKIGQTTTTLTVVGANVPLNVWTHLALTYDGSELAIWKDGVKVGSTPLSGTPSFTSGLAFALGNNPAGVDGRAFRGALRDFRVHGSAHSAEQLRLSVQGDPYSLWRAQRFTGPAIDDPAISGPLAAPLGDGVPNKLKFALGYSPDQYVSAAIVPGEPLPGVEQPSFEFQRSRKLPEELRAQIQVSTDLQTWTAPP